MTVHKLSLIHFSPESSMASYSTL